MTCEWCDNKLIEKAPAGDEIRAVCRDLMNLLLEKNRKYSNSALEPSYTFSRASPVEQINTRIDDKLKRITNRQDDEDEDPEWDLMGYLVLLRIAKRREQEGK